MRSNKILAFLLVTALLGGATSAQETPPAVAEGVPMHSGVDVPAGNVAVIGGRKISVKRFVDAVYLRFHRHAKGVEALDNLLQRKIIAKKAEERGLTVTDADLAREYDRLDAEVRAASEGQATIASVLEEKQLTREEFMEPLRVQLALRKMAQDDFERDDISPADQVQWLRAKMIEARVERDPGKLPENAAARVYDDFVTRDEFARHVMRLIPDADVVDIVKSLMQRDLAEELCRERGITIDEADREAEYARSKRTFETTPRFEGLRFEDFIQERTGMSPEDYKASPNFYREVCLSRLGEQLVGDDDVEAAYREQLEHYGPIYELRHILVRGSDDPAAQGVARSKSAAREQAQAIVSRLEKGESFEEAVKLYSEDRASKFRQGVLGSFTPATIRKLPAVAAVVEEMEIGDFRGPLETKAGYHVVKLHAKKPAPPISTEIVADVRKRSASRFFAEKWRESSRGYDLRRFGEP